MSEFVFHRFESAGGASIVALPFSLTDAWEAIGQVRAAMVRSRPEQFSRNEWAYLMQFVSRSSLSRPFVDHFGTFTTANTDLVTARQIVRPRGRIALWLPSNVSLLGPLAIMQLLLSGNRLLVKAPVDIDGLGGVFLDFLHNELPEGSFRQHVLTAVEYASFARDDARAREWISSADVRVVFGSDAAVLAIDALPHPVDSVSVAFADRRSEASRSWCLT